MIVVYTGEGKGKTSAALGQVIRALGHGLRVACVQFMKRDGVAGEQRILKQLLQDDFLAGGLGFFRDRKEYPRHRAASLEALNWAREKVASGVQVCILDEAICALHQGLILAQELKDMLQTAATHGAHVVLTGRDAPNWLVEQADIVTEMACRKHHFSGGQTAVRGMEY
ncbi:MAG TPA: cob(I)yrinic acid a,c-diamide adenosyltransferase [Desulfonatronum sp.]|nr:cob(I)yrinic acid a,c-diamide adenosyltransferase [Desulfonatronum sp.]